MPVGQLDQAERLLEAARSNARGDGTARFRASFNLGWEPIVNTPQEAYATFMSSGVDVLCMGHFLLRKPEQRSWVSVEEQQRPQVLMEDLLASPCCGAQMRWGDGKFACAECGHAVKYFFPAVENTSQAVREYRSWKKYLVQ